MLLLPRMGAWNRSLAGGGALEWRGTVRHLVRTLTEESDLGLRPDFSTGQLCGLGQVTKPL